MTFLLPIATLLLAVNAKASVQDEVTVSNIIGGRTVNIEDFPHQVAILMNENLWCGGSILTKQHVLTAAHCVFEASGSLVVHSGSAVWAEPRTVHHVESNVTAGPSLDTDVAVLRVTEPFEFDATRQPVKLAPKGYNLQGGLVATVSGWGVTSEDDYDVSDFLMAVDVPIVDRQSCNSSYKGELVDTQICAGSFGKDSCKGDSGGALILNGLQVGIVSKGDGCGVENFPGIYTDVSYFYDWIMKQIC